MRLRSSLCLILLGLMGIVGCGGPTSKVTGTLKWRGNSISGADVTFVNDAESNARFVTMTRADGSFDLIPGAEQPIVPGSYTVKVQFYVMRDGKPLPGGEEGDSLKGTPKTVQLEATVKETIKEGDNNVTLDVTKAAKVVPEDEQ